MHKLLEQFYDQTINLEKFAEDFVNSSQDDKNEIVDQALELYKIEEYIELYVTATAFFIASEDFRNYSTIVKFMHENKLPLPIQIEIGTAGTKKAVSRFNLTKEKLNLFIRNYYQYEYERSNTKSSYAYPEMEKVCEFFITPATQETTKEFILRKKYYQEFVKAYPGSLALFVVANTNSILMQNYDEILSWIDDINIIKANIDGSDLLFNACVKDNIELVEKFISLGIDLENKNIYGLTALDALCILHTGPTLEKLGENHTKNKATIARILVNNGVKFDYEYIDSFKQRIKEATGGEPNIDPIIEEIKDELCEISNQYERNLLDKAKATHKFKLSCNNPELGLSEAVGIPLEIAQHISSYVAGSNIVSRILLDKKPNSKEQFIDMVKQSRIARPKTYNIFNEVDEIASNLENLELNNSNSFHR